ncbi:MAG: DUF2207 domain-containing protein [Chloroflexi bacterium]|nr:DUF2207 domain-containing protein [Chloroflexota bacterium]
MMCLLPRTVFGRGASLLAALLTLAAALLPTPSRAAACGPAGTAAAVRELASDLVINPDASVTVRETIRVTGDDRIPLVREIPTRYRAAPGHTVSLDILLEEARRDGTPWHAAVSSSDAAVRIQLARPDAAAPGEHTYTLTYRFTGGVIFLEDRDRLVWPLLGSVGPAPPGCLTATIQLPPGVPPIDIHGDGWIGRPEAPVLPIPPTVERGGIVAYTVDGAQIAGRGLTIAVDWPRGFVREPSRLGRGLPLVARGESSRIALLGLLLTTLYGALAVLAVRRPSARPPAAPVVHPPDRLSPAALRFLTAGACDARALAATILNLAVLGHLIIRERRPAPARAAPGTSGPLPTFTLVRRPGPARRPPAPEEGAVLFELLGFGGAFQIGPENAGDLRRARSELRRLIGALYEDRYFATRGGYLVPALLLATAALGASALAELQRAALDLAAGVLWLIIALALVYSTALVLGLVLLRVRFARLPERLRVGGIALAGFLAAYALTAAALEAIARSPWPVIAAVGGLSLELAVLRLLLASPARDGRRIRRQIEEFRQFLTAAGRQPDRLMDRSSAPGEDDLPYAVALEAEEGWPIPTALSAGSEQWLELEPDAPGRSAAELARDLCAAITAALTPAHGQGRQARAHQSERA